MDHAIVQVFQDVFGIPREKCVDSLSPESVEGWDSIHHMTLVMTLEQSFGVVFTPEEMTELVSIRKIKDILAKHVAN